MIPAPTGHPRMGWALFPILLFLFHGHGAETNGRPYFSLDGKPQEFKMKTAATDPNALFEQTQRRIDFSQRRDFDCALFGGNGVEHAGRVRFPAPTVAVQVTRSDRLVTSNVPLTSVREIRFMKYLSRPLQDDQFQWVPGESLWVLRNGSELKVKKPVDALLKLTLMPEGGKGSAKYIYTYFVDYLVKGYWLNARKKADHRVELAPPDAVVRRILFQEEISPPP